MLRLSLVIFLSLWSCLAWAAAPVDGPRATALFQELRCVVCKGESIADSSADVAADMRAGVRAMIAQGKSDDDIKSFFVSRYGDAVLMTPRLSPHTWLLWLAPLVLLGLGIAIIFAYFSAARIGR